MEKIFGVVIIILALVVLFVMFKSGTLPEYFRPPAYVTETGGSVSSTPRGTRKPVPPSVPEPETKLSPPSVYPRDVPEGFTAEQLSPFFHKVRLGRIYPGSRFDDRISIGLYSSFSGTSTVNVSGWRIQGNKGSQIIGKAASFYPSYGQATETDILLRGRDYLTLSTGLNPLGVNFRINKCMGYIESALTFDPSLNAGCPALPPVPKTLSGVCQDFIYSLRRCRAPDSNPPPHFGQEYCYDYLRDINYRGCVELHRNDDDFSKNEWRVWIGSNNKFLDILHDRVLLYDTGGLLVDIKTY